MFPSKKWKFDSKSLYNQIYIKSKRGLTRMQHLSIPDLHAVAEWASSEKDAALSAVVVVTFSINSYKYINSHI